MKKKPQMSKVHPSFPPPAPMQPAYMGSQSQPPTTTAPQPSYPPMAGEGF